MATDKFTDNEKQLLMKNPYIKNVGDKGITYTKEFKVRFLKELEKGKRPTDIFRESGFDVKLIGKTRIVNFNTRVKRDGIEDRRKGKSGRPRIYEKQEMSDEENIEFLKHKNALLEQENEYLKKMIFLGTEVVWLKSQHQEDMK